MPPSALAPPGSEHISRDGYRLDALSPSPDAPDLLVLVSMSGGGKRSASFAYGALKGMREVTVPTRFGPRPLLQQVDAIAGVSGGSFPAAYYGLYRDAAFDRFETDFLYQDTESYIWGIYLLPWNWTWLVDPRVGTNDFMERVYDRTMFHGATFADLKKRGRPIIAINATDLAYGTPFMFTQENFDLICSDLSTFPIARAVAASNGFPGLFSPITLTNRAAQCGGRRPGWLEGITEAQRQDPLSRLGVQAEAADNYLDQQKTHYLHLVDGGISDNLALRTGGSMAQAIQQSAAELRGRGFLNLRRLLVLSIDGQGTQDSTIAQRQMVGGIFSLLGLVSGAQIDRYNFETLTTMTDQINAFAHAIGVARCAEAPIIDGARCDDVSGALIHISLAKLPPSPAQDKLLAIPTGLTIPRADVDSLVAAGETAVATSEPLRQFLANYPPRIAAAPRPHQSP
ncbi:MAG TPA: patatin-like phospholipase family protein [Rhodopila sp.]|nr:patatin-like phospholipase family protein [Rhodopila sp.]